MKTKIVLTIILLLLTITNCDNNKAKIEQVITFAIAGKNLRTIDGDITLQKDNKFITTTLLYEKLKNIPIGEKVDLNVVFVYNEETNEMVFSHISGLAKLKIKLKD